MGHHHIEAARRPSQFLQCPELVTSTSQGPNGEQISMGTVGQGNSLHRGAKFPKTCREVNREDLRTSPIPIGDQLQDPQRW